MQKLRIGRNIGGRKTIIPRKPQFRQTRTFFCHRFFASLPRPLIDMRYSTPFERQLLYLQLKVLCEVDETPRPPGYWQDFLDRLIPQLGALAEDFGMPWANEDPETARTMLVGFVAAAYPGAKRYLIEEVEFAREQVEAYPTAQVVFLAMVRFYDEARDEHFKWTHLPYHHARMGSRKAEQVMHQRAQRIGRSSVPAGLLLPAVFSFRTALARLEQQLALLDYQYHGDQAILNGHPLPGLRYRVVLRLAE